MASWTSNPPIGDDPPPGELDLVAALAEAVDRYLAGKPMCYAVAALTDPRLPQPKTVEQAEALIWAVVDRPTGGR